MAGGELLNDNLLYIIIVVRRWLSHRSGLLLVSQRESHLRRFC